MDELESAYRAVQRRIQRACERARRDPISVRLISVSKTKPVASIRQALLLGLRDFGENYAQELAQKHAELADVPDLRWHMIGHVQRNKARLVVEHAHVVHAIDSVRLVTELAARAEAKGLTLDVFIAVNVGQEPQKHGCTESELTQIVNAARAACSLNLLGLMTLPPYSPEPEASRPHFQRLYQLAQDHGLPRLSMGMSHDFEVAIEEGATDVRVGSALFGART